MAGRTRYFQLQEALQAAVLAFLHKHEEQEVTVENLRRECPALVHDDIGDEDIQICLSALEADMFIALNMTGDWNFSYYPSGRPEMRLDNYEEWMPYVEGEREDSEKLEREKFNYIKSLSLTEFGLDSLERKRLLKGDKFRFFSRLSDEEIEDYFENLISNAAYIEPIKYADKSRIIDLDQVPLLKAELASGLEELLRAIQSNNAVMSSKSSEMVAEIDRLKAGIEIVKSGKFSVGKIEGALFGCLTFFAGKFADAPIGELAQGCWSILKTSILHFIA